MGLGSETYRPSVGVLKILRMKCMPREKSSVRCFGVYEARSVLRLLIGSRSTCRPFWLASTHNEAAEILLDEASQLDPESAERVESILNNHGPLIANVTVFELRRRHVPACCILWRQIHIRYSWT